jgi:multidrug efflux pump subunit AcrB
VQNEVNNATDLPQDAETPEINRVSPPFRLIVVALVGDGMEGVLTGIADDLAYELKKIYGVYEVNVTGRREPEVWVEIDPLRMEGYGLSLHDVVSALRTKNINLPGGILKQDGNEFLVRTVGESLSVRDFEDIAVSRNPQGGHVYLRDIARVSDTFEEPVMIAHIDGQHAILLNVRQNNFGKIADITAEIKQTVERYRAQLPDGAELLFAHDNSLNLDRRLGILYSNGLGGLLLVMVSLYFFIGLRPALLTAIGIPLALCATVALMELSRITINSISLFAIIIVLGMLVDDAIVVCENVYRYIEAGMPVREAALLGSQEVFWPVISAIATTCAAFLPLLLMEGPIGKFMSTVPKVVIFALLASVWEAFFVLPSHLAEIARPIAPKHKAANPRHWFARLLAVYLRILTFLMRHRYRAVLSLALVFVIIFSLAFGTLQFILFPKQDFDTITINVAAPPGLTLNETDKATRDALAVIAGMPPGEILNVTSATGKRMAALGFKEGGTEIGSNYAEIEVRLTYDGDRERNGAEIFNDLGVRLQKLPYAPWYSLDKQRMGPPVGRDVLVRVTGDDFAVLSRIARRVTAEMAQIDGLTDIEDDYRPGKDEMRVFVDEERAAMYGLTVEDVATSVQYAHMGGIATTFSTRNEEFDVVVKLDERFRTASIGILELKVRNSDGALIPLKDVAELRRTGGFGKIRRFDQRRVINVTANTINEVITPSNAQQEISRRMQAVMRDYPGYTLNFGGEVEDTRRSMASLFRAFGLALLLIYMILATMFKSFLQPFMIMLSIPFSLLGVFIGLVLTQTPMGMMTFMGVTALAGIVVNDSIVLISFINDRSRGDNPLPAFDAVVDACRVRLRPIMLTQITTILGLMPLALGLGGREVLMTPMAIAIVWGLIFACWLNLLFLPCFYLINNDLTRLAGRLLSGKSKAVLETAP